MSKIRRNRLIIRGGMLSSSLPEPGFASCLNSSTRESEFGSESSASWLFSSRMTTLALTDLLGATVYDPSGAAGRVREVTIAPQEDRSRIASLIVKTKSGNRVLAFAAVSAIEGGIRATTVAASGRRRMVPRDCSFSSATCSTSRSSTSTDGKSSASMTSTLNSTRKKTLTQLAPSCVCFPSTSERAARSVGCCAELRPAPPCMRCSTKSRRAIFPGTSST